MITTTTLFTVKRRPRNAWKHVWNVAVCFVMAESAKEAKKKVTEEIKGCPDKYYLKTIEVEPAKLNTTYYF